MDNSTTQHRTLIIVSLLICLFLYLDSFLFPLRHTVETIKDLTSYRSTGRRGTSDTRTFTMTTEKRAYDIPGPLFAELNIDAKIGLDKSYITGAIQKLYLDTNDGTYIYAVGFMRTGLGKIFVPVMILAALAMLLSFKTIDNIKGRAYLTYAVFICSLLLFIAHMELNII